MSKAKRPIIETRYEQMFPILDSTDIDRLRRFSEIRKYTPGDYLIKTGEVSPGMFVILAGQIEITQSNEITPRQSIVTHGPGSFTGELAQLSGRPSLVDGCALTAVDALVISSEKIQSLMVEEAELGELIMRALILRRVGLLETRVGGPVIIGRANDGDVLRLEGFLARNGHPHQRLDPDIDSCGRVLIERFHIMPDQLPMVLCPNGELLQNPSESDLARYLGLVKPIDPSKIYDVAIVGAGPSGLAAAVYAGSEGLSVIVLDCRAFGGQAGASARIENYLGFPTGITGIALMARAYNQAQKFGVEMAIPGEVVDIQEHPGSGKGRFVLGLANNEHVTTRSVVIASGAKYRRPAVENLQEFEGTCVHYWASPLEAKLCAGQEVALVGGGNSAGQAAVYLASQVSKVWLLVRAPDLTASMSRYLINRIAAQPNIEVLTNTEVNALLGRDGILNGIRCRNRDTGAEGYKSIRHLFLFIGADPNTEWLSQIKVALDDKGFVRTDVGLGIVRPLETNRPGIFAIGDVRSRSIKRVASAVGEGAQVVAAIHDYLAHPNPTTAINTPTTAESYVRSSTTVSQIQKDSLPIS